MQKGKKIFSVLAGIASLGIVISSCTKFTDAKVSTESAIYMPQAEGTRAILPVILADTPQVFVFGAAYGGLKYPSGDINVSFTIDTNAIASYNTANGTSYETLPAASYSISGLSATIKSGTTSSDALKLSIISSKLHFGTHYMLPVTIASASSGKIDSSLRTAYFAIDTIVRQAVDFTGLGTLSVSADNTGGPNASEGSSKVVDGDYNTKFLVFGYTPDLWIQLAFAAGHVAGAYTLTSGNDSPERDPKDWTLTGSNDGSIWTTVDSRSGESFSGRNQTKRYELDNTMPYTYYRLNITANNGDGLFQMSEWRLIEYH